MSELRQWMRSWNLPSSKAPQANNSSIKWSKRLDYEKFGSLDCNTQIQRVILRGLNSIRRYVFISLFVCVFMLLLFSLSIHDFAAAVWCPLLPSIRLLLSQILPWFCKLKYFTFPARFLESVQFCLFRSLMNYENLLLTETVRRLCR